MRLLLRLCLALFAVALPVRAGPPVKNGPGIQTFHGLTQLSRDRSGRAGDSPNKYFHESTFHPHYDGRFAGRILTYPERRARLSILIQTYLSTMHDIGAETWIMHGSLLGWWWNRKIMPWDSDVDVQMSEPSMRFLAEYYNMTVHTFRLPSHATGSNDGPSGDESADARSLCNFMLEVNPHYVEPSTTDKFNVIDARWIDLSTGLFIDITTLRANRTAAALGQHGLMYCKDKHRYRAADIFPLRDSVFEGTPVKIPYAYSRLLIDEYGTKSLTKTTYEGHRFDEKKGEWVPNAISIHS